MESRANRESLSLAVVEAVAEAEGVEPDRLPPLHGSVDPEALDALFQPAGESRDGTDERVTFAYADYLVTVTRDGQVALDR